MNKILRYLLALYGCLAVLTNSYSQCTPARSDDCDGANVLCGLTAMNGYTCQNADYPNMQGPPSLCPGWGPPTNIGWWAFVTSGGNVCITVTYNNCKFPPPGGTNGIQLGIYEDCSFGNLLICDATCPGPTGTKTICANLAACKVYYFFVDGCNGDVCDFTLQTTGGASPKLDPIGKINNDADQKIEVCKGACKQKFTVNAQKAGCESMYKWTLDGVDQGVNSNTITLDFPDEGNFILCATALIGTASSICDKDGPVCATITVKKLDDKKGGPYHICPEKVPYNWHGEIIDMSGTYRKEFRDANCCYFDSVVDIIIQPVPTIPDYYFIGCNPTDVFKDPITGRIFNNCESQTLVPLPSSTDPYRCDSSYYLTAVFLKFNTIFIEKCVSQEIEINPQIINQSKSCGGGETYSFSYNWYLRTDPLKKSIGTDEKLLVTKKDEYCLELSVDTKLGSISKNCKLEFCETLDENKFNLNKICPIGDTLSCVGGISIFYIDTNIVKDIKNHYWTVTNGTIITPNPIDSSRIMIKWASTPGIGKICYSYVSECGTGPDCCYQIIINDAPHPFAGKDMHFCGLNGKFDGTRDKNGYWQIFFAPGNVLIQDSNDIKSNLSVDSFGKYTFLWTEKLNTCIVSDTVELLFSENPYKEPEVIICSGNNADYKIKFEIKGGNSPYTLKKGSGSIDINNFYTSGPILNNVKDTIIIEDSKGCSFEFIHDFECRCTNQIGSLDSTAEKLCEDELLLVLYDTSGQILDQSPEDTLIFFIYDNPSDPLNSILRELKSLNLAYDQNLQYNKQYFVGAYLGRKNNRGGIDFNQGCIRITKSGKPFQFIQKPNVAVGPDTSICGSSIDLMAFQSIKGSSLLWKQISGPGVIISKPTDPLTSVTIQGGFGRYGFEVKEENKGICEDRDTILVDFYPNPDITNIEKICVDLNKPGRYIVKAEIINGKSPYNLITAGGVLNNNSWVSDTLVSLNPFELQIKDSNGCISTRIQDVFNCNCGIIDAGILDSSTLIVCEDQCVQIKNILSEQTVPFEDTAMYVLHTGFFKNAIDTFYSIQDLICFDQTKMKLGLNNIYYISRIVGDDKSPKDGTVDDKDPCLRVSNNQPVIWVPFPIAQSGRDTTICGLQYMTDAEYYFGNGLWTLISGPGTASIDSNTVARTNIQVSHPGTYTFKWELTYFNCIKSDTLSITFADAPLFIDSTLKYECDANAENYRVHINVQNGDKKSWNILGTANNKSLQGSFDVNQPSEWVSDWIQTGSGFSLNVHDQFDCSTDIITGTHDCPCVTRIGNLNKSILKLCSYDTAITNYNPQQQILDGNDAVFYILYDGLANDPKNGSVIQQNATGRFVFDSLTMQRNKSYFIVVVVGNRDSSTGKIIWSDRCLSYDVVEVIWYSKPTPIIQGDKTITCSKNQITLDGRNSSSTSGSTILYQWTTTNGHFVNPLDFTKNQIIIDKSGTYILTIKDSILMCSNTINWIVGSDTSKPFISIEIPDSLTCDHSVIELDGSHSQSGTNFLPHWDGPGITTNPDFHKINVNSAGAYLLTIQNTVNGCADSLRINVLEDKIPPSSLIKALAQLGCSIDQIQLDGSSSKASSGAIGSYHWIALSGNIISGLNSSEITIGKPGGIYILTVRDNRNGCMDSDTLSISEMPNPLKEFVTQEMNPSCFGERDGMISIISVLDSSGNVIQNLEYAVNGASYSTKNQYSNLSQGEYVISARDKNGCYLTKKLTIKEPSKLSISVIRQIIVNQGDLVHLDTLLLGLFGGTSINSQYKDTLWFNTDDQQDWKGKLAYYADKTRDFIVTGIDQADCEVTDHIKILVRVVREIWWPNIFSPNTDNVNDYFNIYGKRIKNIKSLQMFDRWGNRVYSGQYLQPGNNQSTQGWDGNFKGEKALPGVYTFYAEIEYEDSELPEIISGEVTLVR